jgi:hypothetical protein
MHFYDTFANKIYPFTSLDRSLGLKDVEASKIFTQSPHKGGGIVKRFMKNFSDSSGNLTCDLQNYSAVPQPTVLLRAPNFMVHNYIKVHFSFFNVAPCMLPHLLYNPTHALFTLFTSRSPTDKNTKHAQMTYTCGHILRNNTNSTNANQREK